MASEEEANVGANVGRNRWRNKLKTRKEKPTKKARRPFPKFPPGAIGKMRQLRAEGRSYRQIGDHFGTDEHTAYNYTKMVKVKAKTEAHEVDHEKGQEDESLSPLTDKIQKLVQFSMIREGKEVMTGQINRQLQSVFGVPVDDRTYKATRAALLSLSGPGKMFDARLIQSENGPTVFGYTLKPKVSEAAAVNASSETSDWQQEITKNFEVFRDERRLGMDPLIIRFQAPSSKSVLRISIRGEAGVNVVLFTSEEYHEYRPVFARVVSRNGPSQENI